MSNAIHEKNKKRLRYPPLGQVDRPSTSKADDESDEEYVSISNVEMNNHFHIRISK